ncbi:uncharacterized protein LOC6531662 [Drosophila yakuba]|uniref:Uncharacterized protein n=1 Tax=Drosophila yakuba TaxID=7245 RepID=B4P814_DROYA|nr:uncharacterized protein LOC6531662 [Drosophila yakuba]EDW92169.1 uncharacterized protein Dyak_GE14202 [Drosophila yakuba]
MARRKNKEQMLMEMFKRPKEVEPRQTLENQKKPNPKRRTINAAAAAKRYNFPRTLNRRVIRQICRLPPETCNQKTQAQVMYFNSNYGRNKNASLSPKDCHEPTCPKVLSALKAKENLRMSPASRQRSQKHKRKSP